MPLKYLSLKCFKIFGKHGFFWLKTFTLTCNGFIETLKQEISPF